MRGAAFATIAKQEVASLERAVPKAARAQRICRAAYPMLRAVAWGTAPEAELTPGEAFALHESNWRHLDDATMNRHERPTSTMSSIP